MPHRRHALGKRRGALIAAALFCLSRAYAYAPWAPRSGLLQEPILLLTLDGRLLVLYAALWAAVAMTCLASLPRGGLTVPFSGVIGLMSVWGMAWMLGWAAQPHTGWWQTALTYAAPAVWTAALIGLTPRIRREPEEGEG